MDHKRISGTEPSSVSLSQSEKGRDLTQSYDKRPYTHRKIHKKKPQRDNIKTPQITSITQRLLTDLGRSVGVTAVTPLMWLNWFTSAQPSH